MSNKRESLTINQVRAIVKDIKVSGKGIVLNLENVQLTGSQISELSALVGGGVWLNLQERLPESRAHEVHADQLSIDDISIEISENSEDAVESSPILSDEQVLGELELNQ